MNDHLRPVGKPAPPRPRRPEALTSLMIQSWPLSMSELGAVPGAARARAREAPVVEAVEVAEDAVLVLEHAPLASVRASDLLRVTLVDDVFERRRHRPPGTRPGAPSASRASPACPAAGRRAASRTAPGQVLVGVLADLHDRRVGAAAEALDLLPGEAAVARELVRDARRCAPCRSRSAPRSRAACTASCRIPADGRSCPPGQAGTSCRRSRSRARGCRPCPACRRRRGWRARCTQPSCSWARHSSASTAEASLPGGYLAISRLAQARFSGVKAKLSGCSG